MAGEIPQQDSPFAGWGKFRDADEEYFSYVGELESLRPSIRDLMFQFPLYAGHVNLGRYLFFYDLYKSVVELNGHIADLGTYKGASFVFLAKLVRLFEPYNTTQVHGFDWFRGMEPGANDFTEQKGDYIAEYDTLVKLIALQKLDDVAILHKMDLVEASEHFLTRNRHLRFKLVFVDCGIEKVLEACMRNFWPRLVRGGVLVVDHYNCEVSPTESDIVERYVGDNLIRQMPFNRQPTAYVVKESVQ